MKNSEKHDDVPLFRKWWHWYALVVGFLLLLILLFSLFTSHFE
jgi:uncharacterized integral membrane protein